MKTFLGKYGEDSVLILLNDLVDQIRKTQPIDDHGHKFVTNNAYLRALEYLAMRGGSVIDAVIKEASC